MPEKWTIERIRNELAEIADTGDLKQDIGIIQIMLLKRILAEVKAINQKLP